MQFSAANTPTFNYCDAPRPQKDEEIADMDSSMRAVEDLLNYRFMNKKLLEEALTHPSYTGASSYQRLEFVGDAALGLAFSNFVFLRYPGIEPGKLSLVRAANISTEKLARVAVRHQLYKYVRHNVVALDEKVREFVMVVREEDETEIYGGLVKAPKVLADIVEAVAAAVYVDCNFDLKAMWERTKHVEMGIHFVRKKVAQGHVRVLHVLSRSQIADIFTKELPRVLFDDFRANLSIRKPPASTAGIIRDLLEPMVMLDALEQQPQPVTVLFELCQKDGKQVQIKYWRKEEKIVASIYVDGELVTSASSDQKENAKLHAAKAALQMLSSDSGDLMNDNIFAQLNEDGEIEGAKQKLHELCCKKKWPKPNYETVKEFGRAHEKRYICSVGFKITEDVMSVTGKEKSRKKQAENSAASLLLFGLKDSAYI